ncbi:hypothetical protein B0H17DRAFT_1061785 [Mycena rosella]|uniref:Uncharacterized protein n=1 Tax=Mycena rosella TaxID=1033263 RepID=A0AAD7DHR9_MYCRO|nr:hypothetical protein B0H17DRAFT_1061785 [Mycena rosella]
MSFALLLRMMWGRAYRGQPSPSNRRPACTPSFSPSRHQTHRPAILLRTTRPSANCHPSASPTATSNSHLPCLIRPARGSEFAGSPSPTT